ncbi:MAG: flippase-like domain-containing protein [Anaerolineae bacterium]|nr:flippase-like domain-containing protein [Anaerolineae bacterium]
MIGSGAGRATGLAGALRWGIGLAIAALAIWALLQGLEWGAIAEALAAANYRWVGLAVAAVLATVVARAFRWQALLNGQRVGFPSAVAAILVGQVVNTGLPILRSGDIARAAWTSRREAVSVTQGLGAIVLEKVWDLLALGVTGLSLLVLIPLPAWFVQSTWGVLVVVGLGLGVLWVGLRWQAPLLRLVGRLMHRLPERISSFLVPQLHELVTALDAVRQPRSSAAAGLWTVATWLLGGVANWAVMQAFGIRSVYGATFLLAALMLGSAAVPTPGRIGVFEGISVVSLTQFGVEPNLALAISVIVPAYNEGEQVGVCVRALAEQSVARGDYEILVVDDASIDATAAIAQAAGADRVLTIEHGGAAAARNAGLRAASGEVVLFTDADCAPCHEWIESMVRHFRDPAVMGVKGTYRTRQGSLIARLVQLEFEMRYERMATLPEIDFIDTYAAAYRRHVLVEEGGFDVDYPVPSAEDVDLSFRLSQRGYHLVFAPEAWVWHTHPVSLYAYLRRKMRFGYWRALLYLRYPAKIGGDAHTDPALKVQFGLVALVLLFGVGGLLWPPLWLAAGLCLAAFLLTTMSFVRWAWRRDRAVALVWPGVALLRVALQGAGLAVGLLVHRFSRAV